MSGIRILLLKRARWLTGIVIGACLLTLALLNVGGYLLGCEYISVWAAVETADQFEMRSELLMAAMDRVGVCSPTEAAAVWAEGLRTRSAALQYAVMSGALREEYAAQLEQTAPGWVTGVSSPWVERYELDEPLPDGGDAYIVALRFFTETSAGPGETYRASLRVSREGAFWRIRELQTDPELAAYTGFQPVQTQ